MSFRREKRQGKGGSRRTHGNFLVYLTVIKKFRYFWIDFTPILYLGGFWFPSICRSFSRWMVGVMDSKLDIAKILETPGTLSIPLGPSVMYWLLQIGCFLILSVLCACILKNKQAVLFFLSATTLSYGVLYVAAWALSFLIFHKCCGLNSTPLVYWLLYAPVACFLSALSLSAVFTYRLRNKAVKLYTINSICSLLGWLFLGFKFCSCISVFMKNEVSIGAIRRIFLP